MQDRLRLAVLGVLLEALLAGTFFVWAWYYQVQYRLLPDGRDWILGISLAIALLAANGLFLAYLKRRYPEGSPILRFVDEVVVPLATLLGPWVGIPIAIAAGVGEELFFRGMLQPMFGLLIASGLFSLLHFGTAIRIYPSVALLYFLIGIGFGYLYKVSESLPLVIIAHAVYDYFAILYLCYYYRPAAR